MKALYEKKRCRNRALFQRKKAIEHNGTDLISNDAILYKLFALSFTTDLCSGLLFLKEIILRVLWPNFAAYLCLMEAVFLKQENELKFIFVLVYFANFARNTKSSTDALGIERLFRFFEGNTRIIQDKILVEESAHPLQKEKIDNNKKSTMANNFNNHAVQPETSASDVSEKKEEITIYLPSICFLTPLADHLGASCCRNFICHWKQTYLWSRMLDIPSFACI